MPMACIPGAMWQMHSICYASHVCAESQLNNQTSSLCSLTHSRCQDMAEAEPEQHAFFAAECVFLQWLGDAPAQVHVHPSVTKKRKLTHCSQACQGPGILVPSPCAMPGQATTCHHRIAAVLSLQGLSAIFGCLRGVKKGCPLSLTLFELYFDGLEKRLLEQVDIDALTLRGVLVPSLLYADGLILMSTSAAGLQKQLEALASSRDRRQLTVHFTKTKAVVVFEP